MRVIELVITEELDGVQAISIVDEPAIEVDFVKLSKQKEEVRFKAVDEEKRILVGLALIPNKPIYRNGVNGGEDYYIMFSNDTVRQSAYMYLKNGFQANTTLDHEKEITGLTVVESWIVESEKDKIFNYIDNAPLNSWAVVMKVDNDDIWNNFIKTGKIKGFSIEGVYESKANLKKEDNISELYNKVKNILNENTTKSI